MAVVKVVSHRRWCLSVVREWISMTEWPASQALAAAVAAAASRARGSGWAKPCAVMARTAPWWEMRAPRIRRARAQSVRLSGAMAVGAGLHLDTLVGGAIGTDMVDGDHLLARAAAGGAGGHQATPALPQRHVQYPHSTHASSAGRKLSGRVKRRTGWRV